MTKLIELGLALLVAGAACAKKSDPAQTASGESGTLQMSGTGGAKTEEMLPKVHFDFDQDTLRLEDRNKLKAAANFLEKNSDLSITIEGNCDERGSTEYNLALGERRANSVRKYLEQLGINSKRLTTVSFGKERPAVLGSTEEAWAMNRRADIVASERTHKK